MKVHEASNEDLERELYARWRSDFERRRREAKRQGRIVEFWEAVVDGGEAGRVPPPTGTPT